MIAPSVTLAQAAHMQAIAGAVYLITVSALTQMHQLSRNFSCNLGSHV
jgi:hypothetical protein